MRYLSCFLIALTLLISGAKSQAAREGLGRTIESFEIRGNEKTQTQIIIRALPIAIGHRLVEGDLARCQQVLSRLRMFRTVFVNVKPGKTPDGAVLVIYVQEKRFGDLGVSLEYTEMNGFGIAADAYHANLRGEGKVVGIDYGLGERMKHWGFSYADPWLNGTRQSFHFQVRGSSSDRDLYRSAIDSAKGRYDLERIGASVGVGRMSPLRAYHLIFRYTFEAIQVGDYQKPTFPTNGGIFADEISAAVGRESLSYLSLQLLRNPNRTAEAPGIDFSLSADLSAKPLRSVANFFRLKGTLTKYFEPISGHILSIGGRAGFVWGSPPFYERFYLDGENQMRGVDRRDIGPEGGTQFFLAETVYAIKIKPIGRIYTFAEAGGVRRPIGNLHREDTDFAFGIGLLLFNRIDISFGISTGTVIVKSHRFGGIKIGL